MIYKGDIIILIGLVSLFLYKFSKRKTVQIKLNFMQSIWLWIYFLGVGIISYLSTFGGINILSTTAASILLFILCIITLLLATYITRTPEEIQKNIDEAIKENNN